MTHFLTRLLQVLSLLLLQYSFHNGFHCFKRFLLNPQALTAKLGAETRTDRVSHSLS